MRVAAKEAGMVPRVRITRTLRALCVATHHGSIDARYERQLVEAGRFRLLSFLSLLLRYVTDYELVDVRQSELAQVSGVAERTIRRWEGELADLGIVEEAGFAGRNRVLRVLPPTAAPVPLAPRAEAMLVKRAESLGVELWSSERFWAECEIRARARKRSSI